MRSAIKCVHPLLLVGVGLFILPFLFFPVAIADIIPASKVGPCSVPVFLLFVPGEFLLVLGLGFSAIRLFEMRCERKSGDGEE